MMTKSQITTALASHLSISKKDVAGVLDGLQELVKEELAHEGEAVIPGIAKLTVKRKEATKSRAGVSPFTGEPMTFKAKPATNVVKSKVMKSIKDSVR